MLKGRKSLLWLMAPYILFLAPLPIVNRVEPLVFGMPFLVFWMLVCMLATPLAVWLAAHWDPLWSRKGEREHADEGHFDMKRENQ